MRRNKKESIAAGSASIASARPNFRVFETRAVEEDLILYSNLKLLRFEAALQQWPEFNSVKKFSLTQNMFSAPNRLAVECIYYFLAGCLLGHEAIKREMKDIWFPKNIAQMREFRIRATERIKKQASEWKISNDIIYILTALLQRNSGQKLVRLFCELSLTALSPSRQTDHPVSGDFADRLTEAKIRVGKAKICQLQNQFLQLVVTIKNHQAEVSNAASKLISKYVDLTRNIDCSKEQLITIQAEAQIDSPLSSNQVNDNFVPTWNAIDTALTDLEELERLMASMTYNVVHPSAVSGEKLLNMMRQSFSTRPLDMPVGTEEERTSFESEFAASAGIAGKTEVDLLSVMQFWLHCGVEELVSILETTISTNSSTEFAKELLCNNSIPDFIGQTRDSHKKNLEEMKKLQKQLIEDIGKLDNDLEAGSVRTVVVSGDMDVRVPSVISTLQS